MRLALVALAFTFPAASSAEAPPSPARASAEAPAQASALPRADGRLVPSRLCRDDMKPRNAQSLEAARLRRLGELPPGDLTLTVVNQVGECMEPIVVRQGVGGLDGRPGR
jgi:hypothetical protein